MKTNTAEVFEYLDELRESGVTNMSGAAPYIQGRFDLSATAAKKYLADWTRTFSRDKTAAERAAEVDA